MTVPPVKKACDACHRRKVRCSGDQPCTNCGQANLQCTYLAVPQKKGPKGSRAKVISEIRVTQQQSHPPSQSQSQSSQSQSQSRSQSTPTRSAGAMTVVPEPSAFDVQSPPRSPPYTRNPALLSKQTIENCLNFYFTNMYTTAWILNRHTLQDMLSSQLATDAEAYCLVASLCAFVMVQPGMNLAVALGSHYAGEPPQNRYGYATLLLDDILRVRKSIDYIESPSLSSVQVSFFLFGCYFTLEKQNTCWFHLREAVTLAQIMGMHEESSYLTDDLVDNMYRRRTYWLLLVTERAYAMERHRPLSLHPTIDLPDPHDAAEGDIIAGFLYLISLFTCIDDEFMALWNKAKTDCSAAWLSQLQQQLTDALPAELKTTESQTADVRISLHWLRIMVWQLSIANGYLSSNAADVSMTFKYPIQVARDLIQDISHISMDAMEVHGVGLIEKLFDVACTLTDVISCVPLDQADTATPTHETSPLDCLNQFLSLISQLRCGTSRYLPLLIAKVSDNLPGIAPVPPLEPMQMAIKQGYAGASDNIPTPMAPDGVQFLGPGGASGLGLVLRTSPPPDPDHVAADMMFGAYHAHTVSDGDMEMPEPPMVTSVAYPGAPGQPLLAPAPRNVPRGVKYDGYP